MNNSLSTECAFNALRFPFKICTLVENMHSALTEKHFASTQFQLIAVSSAQDVVFLLQNNSVDHLLQVDVYFVRLGFNAMF
jgi:hypothetical protein